MFPNDVLESEVRADGINLEMIMEIKLTKKSR